MEREDPILIKADVPLELVAGDPDKGIGYFGVGWSDLSTLRKYYLTLSLRKINKYRKKTHALGGI
ncbi:MAG: hypothetical protein ACE5GD_11500 [Candidatus Geothermarchaeales archaeon]